MRVYVAVVRRLFKGTPADIVSVVGVYATYHTAQEAAQKVAAQQPNPDLIGADAFPFEVAGEIPGYAKIPF